MHTCACAHSTQQTIPQMHMHACICTFLHIWTSMQADKHTHTHRLTGTHTHAHTHAHTHTHEHMRHAHTRSHTLSLLSLSRTVTHILTHSLAYMQACEIPFLSVFSRLPLYPGCNEVVLCGCSAHFVWGACWHWGNYDLDLQVEVIWKVKLICLSCFVFLIEIPRQC